MTYLKQLFFQIIEILFFFFFLTVLYYFDVIGEKSYMILKFVILSMTIFYSSFLLGKNTKSKGYWEGIKYGFILILCFLIPTLFSSSFSLKTLFYYGLVLSISILGSMFGISFSSKK